MFIPFLTGYSPYSQQSCVNVRMVQVGDLSQLKVSALNQPKSVTAPIRNEPLHLLLAPALPRGNPYGILSRISG